MAAIKTINRPIVEREVTAFPCSFKKNEDSFKVYFHFQDLDDSDLNIYPDIVFANISLGGHLETITGTIYEPFEVEADGTMLTDTTRCSITIPAALVQTSLLEKDKGIFPLNTFIDVQIMALSENILEKNPNFLNLLWARVGVRGSDKPVSAPQMSDSDYIKIIGNIMQGIPSHDDNLAYYSKWSTLVSFQPIAQPTFVTWGGLAEDEVKETYSLPDDTMAHRLTEINNSDWINTFDITDKYTFKCQLSFPDMEAMDYYEDDQLDSYAVSLYGYGAKTSTATIITANGEVDGYQVETLLESSNGRLYIDTWWDKTKRIFRHTLKYNFLSADYYDKYKLVISYFTKQGYRATHSYIIQPIESVETTYDHNLNYVLSKLKATPDGDRGVIRLSTILRDKRSKPAQELGVLVVERAIDINAGADETEIPKALSWYTCYEGSYRAHCELDPSSTLVSPAYTDRINYDDASVEPGVFYKYRMRFKIWDANNNRYTYATDRMNGIEENKKKYVETADSDILFVEDIFLATRDLTLKIKYNPDITSFKRNVVDAITPTLGSPYPFVRRNGAQIYRTFNLGGLISYNSEIHNPSDWSFDSTNTVNNQIENNEFFESLFINKAGKNTIDTQRYDLLEKRGKITSEQRRVMYEKAFRDMVIDFLYDDHIVLFKSQQEGNIFIRLSNVSFTPNKTLERNIYSFTATATEVLETSPENYLTYFSPEAAPESAEQNIYLVAGYYGHQDGSLYAGDAADASAGDLNNNYLDNTSTLVQQTELPEGEGDILAELQMTLTPTTT